MGSVRSDSFGKEREVSIKVKRSKSRLAVWSKRLGVMFFVPLAPAIGMLLGLVGMSSVKNNPARTGKGMAAFGFFAGLVFTAAQAWVGWSAYNSVNSFADAPADALSCGFEQNYAGMLDDFTADAGASRGKAAPFVTTLEKRYGSFRGVASSQPAWEWRPNKAMEYTFMFETGHVSALIDWEFEFKPTGFEPRMASVTVTDARRGDVSFPPNAKNGDLASASGD